MSLLERVRPTRTVSGRAGLLDGDAWWQPVVSGALAAAGSWLVLVLPALLVWVITAHTTVRWTQGVGVASAGWFLSHGSTVTVEGMSVSVAPLGLWAVAVAVTTRGLGQLLDRTEAKAKGTTWPRLLGRRQLPGFAAGYAGFACCAWLLTLAGPARPGLLGVLVVLTVPVLATAICLVRRHANGAAAPVVGQWLDRLPRWVERAIGPGLWGSAALLLLGTTLVVVTLVARLSTVTGLYSALGAGLFGGVILTVGQLLLLPNLSIWALAWIAGPGFSVADGGSVTLSGAHPGLMPMLPFLGALPTEGSWPRWVVGVMALPVGIGFAVAWRACRSLARLSSWRTKLMASGAAVVVSATVVGALTVLGTGAAGIERLRHVGPSPLALTAALLGELLLGVLAYVVVDRVRQRAR